ncbi:MAG: alpha/beta hydrolase [Blastocatellales bacterium]
MKVRNIEGNYIEPGVMGDIVYRRVDGKELALDAYVQKRGRARPAVIIIHGGGWDSGSRVAFVGQFLEMLTRAGYNWFSIDYRLGGIRNYKDALDDLRAAVGFVRCHAGEFRVDPNNIALLGEDAGAHLAAMLLAEKPAGVKAAVLIGGFYDLREIPNLKSHISNSDFLAEASPITRLAKTMPATMVVHGVADREAPPDQAVRFCEQFREAGARCEYFPVDGAIHRAENWLPRQWGYKAAILAWLGKELGLKQADHEPYTTNLKKDVVFSPRHNLKLDAYVPKGRGPFPAVIIAHGGGWEAGDKVTYATPLFEPLAKAGFAWFSIDYRLTPQFRHQDQLEDLREAIRYVRSHARSFRIDPRRVAILGESASGQMVAQIAAEKRKDITAVVSFYGVYDFVSMAGEITPRSIPARLFGLSKLDDEARETLRRFSPLHNVNAEMPSMLLLCGTKDRLFAQQEAFARKLEAAGVSHEAFTLKDAPHGMENWEGHPEWMEYKTKLVEWLKAKLTPLSPRQKRPSPFPARNDACCVSTAGNYRC